MSTALTAIMYVFGMGVFLAVLIRDKFDGVAFLFVVIAVAALLIKEYIKTAKFLNNLPKPTNKELS